MDSATTSAVSAASHLAASTAPITRVRDVMTRRIAVARDHDTLAFASQILLWRGIRHLPIVDAQARLVGIVSDRDLLRHVVEGPDGALPLRQIMSTPVETIGADADLTEASARLVIARIDCLPVVEGDTLLGILTSADVLAERGRVTPRGAAGSGSVASDIMNRRVLVAHCGDSLASAIRKLVDAEIRHLPVLDEDERVVGMLSDRDVRTAVGDPRAAAEHDLGGAADEDAGDAPADEGGEDPSDALAALRVDDVMSRSPIAVSPATSVLELAALFADEKIGAAPVVGTDDRLLGIISYVDVIGHFTGRCRAG